MPPRNPNRGICPPDHKHGETTTCYAQHKCGCDGCRERRNLEERKGNARRSDGTTQKYVDAAIVRSHIKALMVAEFRYTDIAKVAGVAPAAVSRIGRGKAKRVTFEVADAILGTRPHMRQKGDPANLHAARGSQRRLQALVANGWSLAVLMGRFGLSKSQAYWFLHAKRITPANRDRIAALYDELWDQPPPRTTSFERSAATRSIALAKSRGWRKPLEWDDIDRDETPDVAIAVDEPGWIVDELEHLRELGESAQQAASLLSQKPQSLAQLARRHHRPDLARWIDVRAA